MNKPESFSDTKTIEIEVLSRIVKVTLDVFGVYDMSCNLRDPRNCSEEDIEIQSIKWGSIGFVNYGTGSEFEVDVNSKNWIRLAKFAPKFIWEVIKETHKSYK